MQANRDAKHKSAEASESKRETVSADLKAKPKGKPAAKSKPGPKTREVGSSGGFIGSLSLGQKLLFGAGLLALVPLILALFFNNLAAIRGGGAALQDASFRQLVSIRDSKRLQIENFFTQAISQSEYAARTAAVVSAMKEFSATYNKYLSQANGGGALSSADIANRRTALASYYSTTIAEAYKKANAGQSFDTDSWVRALSDTSVALQYAYLVKNPNPLGEKDKMTSAQDGSSYSNVHARYQAILSDTATSLGFLDAHLIDRNGVLVFTTAKQFDIGHSVVSGPMANSAMAEAFKSAIGDQSSRKAHLSDSSPYIPAMGETSMFTAAPIYEGNNYLGMITLELPLDTVDAVMTNQAKWLEHGLGKSGETYLVGSDKKLRSNSRFLIEDQKNYLDQITKLGVSPEVRSLIVAHKSATGWQPVDTAGVQQALSGKESTSIFPDYRGVPVLSAFTPLTIPGVKWVLMAEFDQSETLEPVNALQRSQITLALGILALTALIALTAAFLFSRTITRPIGELAQAAEEFGAGNLNVQVPVRSSDEVGQLAQVFGNSVNQIRAYVNKQEEERQKAVELQGNIGDFLNVAMDIAQGDLTKRGKVTEDVLGNVVDAINLITEEIGYLLKEVQKAAQQVNQEADVMTRINNLVLQSAQSQNGESQSARSQVQQVDASIRQVAESANQTATAAEQTRKASQIGSEALDSTLHGMQSIRREVQSISKGIKGLSDRSLEISEIVETISRIASQTNLLALNAAIEAAGAGEAGSRFAIVAGEVRKLAEDSAKATQRVGGLIKGIQNEIQAVVANVEEGTREVEEGYRIANQAGQRLKDITILADQSTELVQGISRTLQEQVAGVDKVQAAVQTIAETANLTEQQVAQGRQAAEQLRGLAQQLAQSLSRFQLPA